MAKMALIWWKKSDLKRLLTQLEEIWPTLPPNEAEAAVKRNSLSSLRALHSFYFWLTTVGVFLYLLKPLLEYAVLTLTGQDAEMQWPWFIYYPFNKRTPVLRELTYAYEAWCGLVSAWAMMGTDLVFAALASHIGMMLRILIVRLRTLAVEPSDDIGTLHELQLEDHYSQIVELIKMHQKMLGYIQQIEDAFTMVFLVNMVLSSVIICCAGFVCVLVDPLLEPSNKVFLVAALYQNGILCWCGDDIFHVNSEVSTAAYDSGWYRCDARCRFALRFLMLRSQRPHTFTAMKFNFVNLATFTSILTTSYSYFTLLSTMYSGNDDNNHQV